MRQRVVIAGIVVLTIAVFLYVGGTSLYDYSYSNYSEAVQNNQFVGLPFVNVLKIDTTPYENGMGLGRLMTVLGFMFIFIGAPMIAIGFAIKENNFYSAISPFGKKTKPSILEKCEIYNKPKGSEQLYLVTKDNWSRNVSEQCADEIDKEDKVRIEKSSVADTENDKEDDPLLVLQLRYVQGEITKEQYEQMKKDLSDSHKKWVLKPC